jgi:hypothetical protein
MGRVCITYGETSATFWLDRLKETDCSEDLGVDDIIIIIIIMWV